MAQKSAWWLDTELQNQGKTEQSRGDKQVSQNSKHKLKQRTYIKEINTILHI